jgi:hypothetical protein
LRSQVEQAEVGVGRRAAGGGGRVGRRRWRTIVAVVCIVVACILAPLSVVAVWTRNQVTNTDRYLATVSPLASDPAIQTAIADQITTQVFRYIDVQALTTQAIAALALVFWGRPTGKVVIGLALALLAVLAIIEFLARPADRAAEILTTPQR